MGLLDLPPEIRLQIYREVLVCSGMIPFQLNPTNEVLSPPRSKAKPHPGVTLLRVNRAIHDEAIPIFLYYNQFIMRSFFVRPTGDYTNAGEAWHSSPKGECQYQAKFLRHVVYHFPCFEVSKGKIEIHRPDLDGFKVLSAQCPRLSTLYLINISNSESIHRELERTPGAMRLLLTALKDMFPSTKIIASVDFNGKGAPQRHDLVIREMLACGWTIENEGKFLESCNPSTANATIQSED